MKARVVLKYDMPTPDKESGRVDIKVPMGSQAVHFGIDGRGIFCVWVECFADNAKAFQQSDYHEVRTWYVFPTGMEFSFEGYSGVHVSTVIVPSFDDIIVCHVYEGVR